MNSTFSIIVVFEAVVFLSLFTSSFSLNYIEITVPEGNESRLVCNIEKEQVIWTRDGRRIKTGADENFQPASNSTLIIKNTARDGASGGMFRVSCLGRISYATDGRIYRVHLTKEPRFLTNNRVISVIENTKVKGPYPECSARGYPEPTISWKIGENIISSANGSVTSALWNYDTDNNGFKGVYRVMKDGTLYIDGFFTKAPTTQNYFQCIARNVVKERRQNYSFVFEEVYTYSFEVTTEKRENLRKEIDKQVKRLHPLFYNHHQLNITFVDEENAIFHFDLTMRERNLVKLYGVPPNMERLAYDVHRTLKDIGLAPIDFIVHGPPTPPTQLFTIETHSDSVTIGWKHPKFFDVDIYYVEIWNNSSKKWENATTVPGQENSATVADLDPETTYNIKMYGENQYGVGALKSNALQVKTKKELRISYC